MKDDKKNTVTIRDSVEEIRRAAGDLGYDKIHTIFQPVRTNGKYTELKVKLITGKTHQIRAQLQHMGYPVIGDRPCHFLLSGISLQGSDNTRSFPMQVQAARNTYMQPIRSPPELLY